MTPTDVRDRPSQVTVAGWAVAIASAILVVVVFSTMSGLQSVETRERITREISSGSLKGLGLSLDGVLTAMRWALFVSGAAAATAGICGAYVLQRNKGARIGLTVAAVPIVLTSPLTGSFLGMFVGAATVILWSRPARDWFAGRPITPNRRQARPAPTPPPAPPVPGPPTAWVPPAAPGAPQPPPTQGWGQWPPPPPYGPPVPYPYGQQPSWTLPAPERPPRPSQVRTACIITWIFSGMTALGYLVLLIALAVDKDELLRLVKDSPSWDPSYDDNVIVTAAAVVGVLFLLWSIGAIVLAVLAYRGASWAWIMLTVSAGLAALISIVAFPYSIVHVVALIACVRMLLVRETREWFSGR